ncbi:Outer membrane protein beta-barrel domain-containing protein [Fibrobacter sp. UWH9]|uniref:outer membrane beta-barrel protein n=1 Tax=Fibrobacter sp. UWH9 TaxID=1896213 RepID=UPI0009167094|nr:outer membrane beta-barrel protein [Fibrobacter sp. UWH9]SHH85752.1 Outer membrane protein beta-barrel domain-containing protein [Fibrobacter sp. UWH9]
MKKVITLSFILLTSLSFASVDINLGFSPYRGLFGIGYTFANSHFSTNVHIPFYNSDYDFVGGVGVGYHIFGKTGPYIYHASDWINGEFLGFKYSFKEKETSTVIENNRSINYWQLTFGLGYQYMFTDHFGAYFEAGFQFYAGDGGYYTHFDADEATLDNEKTSFPAGFGASFSF